MDSLDRNRSQRRRLLLRERLLDIFTQAGQTNPHLYFEPTSSVQMEYPAIIYKRNRIMNRSADNRIYKQDDQYAITVVDRDPDSILVRLVSRMPTADFERSYEADNLHHTVFTIYN